MKAHPYSRSEQDVQAVRIAEGKSTAATASYRKTIIPDSTKALERQINLRVFWTRICSARGRRLAARFCGLSLSASDDI